MQHLEFDPDEWINADYYLYWPTIEALEDRDYSGQILAYPDLGSDPEVAGATEAQAPVWVSP